MAKWFDSKENINAFLGFGYIPQSKVIPDKKILCAKNKKLKLPIDETLLIELGKKRLSKTLSNCVTKYSSKTIHIVPLSGGLDSRAILGGLLENVDKEQIIAITFGIPGTLDYEIGYKVSQRAGVKNYRINLDPECFDWNEKQLVEDAKNYGRPTFFFRGYNVYSYILKNFDFGDDYVFWSGYMGGSLTEDKYAKQNSGTWAKALNHFIKRNNRCKCLTSFDFDACKILPKGPIVKRSVMNYDEQLNLFVRQPYCIYPSTVFSEKVETPLLQEPFLSYLLYVPNSLKANQYLYKKILLGAYSDLFSLSTQTTLGLPLNSSKTLLLCRRILDKIEGKLQGLLIKDKISYNIQFFDWNFELRRSPKLQKLVKKQLNDLSNRNIIDWLDVESFLFEHLDKSKNYGEEIRRLVSLEVFLKAEEKKYE